MRPDFVEAHLNAGRAFQQAGKIEAAREAYLRAIQIDAACYEARSMLATLQPPPPRREDFHVGQQLRWEMTGRICEVLQMKKGGFGAVYIVRDRDDDTWYALKTFQGRSLWSDANRERFVREALTWVMLDRYPNIVTAYWVEYIEGFPCLVLEYVPGGDLAQILQGEQLSPDRALKLAFQFCDAMSYAHEKLGIVHRDVKPANCIVGTRFSPFPPRGGRSGWGGRLPRGYTPHLNPPPQGA